MNRKIKSLFLVVLLCASSAIGFDSFAEGGQTNDNQVTTGWQQYHCRTKKINMDKLHVGFGFNLNTEDKIGLTFNIDTNVSLIDCCTSCSNEYSWCDFDEQNQNC